MSRMPPTMTADAVALLALCLGAAAALCTVAALALDAHAARSRVTPGPRRSRSTMPHVVRPVRAVK